MSSNVETLSCRGLQPLKEGDRIYGRDAEIKDLSVRVQENLHTIIYGQSGAGKSSVIEAGLFPILRQEGFFPVVIRFLEIESPDFVEYVICQVCEVAKSQGYELKPQVAVKEENVSKLLAFFQGTTFEDKTGECHIPILIFDQFEEVLNNPDTYVRGENFIKDIYPLIDDSFCLGDGYLEYSNYRILFSMREDFLYAFEDILDKYNLSELKQNRIRLRFLDKERAEYVVKKILYDSSDKFTDSEELDRLAQLIVEESENTSYSFGISTPVLSLICYQIINNGLKPQDIDKAVIESSIYNFYDNVVAPLSYRCRQFIEDKLITKDGRRASVDVKEAQNNGDISQIDTDKLVNDVRLLSIVNIGNTRRLEFSHDVIVRIVNRKRRTHWQSIMDVIKKPFQFGGCASKEDFYAYYGFWVFLWVIIAPVLTYFISKISSKYVIISHFVLICFLQPLISVTVRRLHAVGKSGWWVLAPFVPMVWASRQDTIRPYKGNVSNVQAFELLVDWKTPPIRKSLDQISYIGRHLYLLYGCFWTGVLGLYIILLIFPSEVLMSNSIQELLGFPLISEIATFINICATDLFDGELFLIFCLIFLCYGILIATMVLLAMRLPHIGFRRFWAFIPVVSLPFWIYGFWPDSHFTKENFRKNKIRLVKIIFTVLLVTASFFFYSKLEDKRTEYVNEVYEVYEDNGQNLAILKAGLSGRKFIPHILLKGHSDYIESVAISPDGKFIVTGSDDYTAMIWDAETGCVLETLSGHSGAVESVAISPDGRRIVTGSIDDTAMIWDAETGNVLDTLSGHGGNVYSVAISSDCKRIVTGSLDDTAMIWDAETGNVLDTLLGHSSIVVSVAISPDGKRIITSSWDKTAMIWEAETGRVLEDALLSHTDWVRSVAISLDGKRIVTGSDDDTAMIWDAETGCVLETLSGHSGNVYSVAISPDGKRIVTGSGDKTAMIWDAKTGRVLETLSGHSGSVNSVAISPDGNRIVTGSSDRTAIVWGRAKGLSQSLKLNDKEKDALSDLGFKYDKYFEWVIATYVFAFVLLMMVLYHPKFRNAIVRLLKKFVSFK